MHVFIQISQKLLTEGLHWQLVGVGSGNGLATSHYLNQSWPRSFMYIFVIRPQYLTIGNSSMSNYNTSQEILFPDYNTSQEISMHKLQYIPRNIATPITVHTFQKVSIYGVRFVLISCGHVWTHLTHAFHGCYTGTMAILRFNVRQVYQWIFTCERNAIVLNRWQFSCSY